MWYYCSKCGMVQYKASYEEKKCRHCKTLLNLIPEKYILQSKIYKDSEIRVIESTIQEDLVKKSPNFNQQLFDELDNYREKEQIDSAKFSEILKQHHPETFGKSAAQSTNVPKCPTCQSTNIRKMGSVERGASILTFGIFSKKINKTFKCNNCGHTW